MSRLVPRPAALLPAALVLIGGGCGPPRKPPGSPAAPAKVGRPVSEGDLAGITLAPEAETRLGIATARIEKKAVGRAALRGAEERLAPILMTALCAALALLPLVIAGAVPGHEIEHPMAVVILGGLFTSTLLNLFVMPALYAAFGKPLDAARAAEGEGG